MPFPSQVWDGDSESRNSDDGASSAPDYQDWQRLITELRETQQKILSNTSDGTGTTEIVEGLSVGEVGNDALHRTILTFTDIVMTITDAGAAGAHGSIKLYTFSVNAVQFFNNILNVSVAAGVGGIDNNAILDIATGTNAVATDNDVLSLLEQDLSTKIDLTLTGGSKSGSVHNTTNQHVEGTSIEMYLNVAIKEDDCDANDTLTINGSITFLWSNCPTT